MLHLIPAYGRDYKTKADVQAAWMAGKDFLVADMSNPWDGKPVNREQIYQAQMEPGSGIGHTSVQIRYGGLRKVAVLSMPTVKGVL